MNQQETFLPTEQHCFHPDYDLMAVSYPLLKETSRYSEDVKQRAAPFFHALRQAKRKIKK